METIESSKDFEFLVGQFQLHKIEIIKKQKVVLQIYTNAIKIVREDLDSEEVLRYQDIKKIELIHKSENEFLIEERDVLTFSSKARTQIISLLTFFFELHQKRSISQDHYLSVNRMLVKLWNDTFCKGVNDPSFNTSRDTLTALKEPRNTAFVSDGQVKN